MDSITTEPKLTTPIPQPISPESGHRRLSTTALPLPPEAEQPPCPRCDSTNTKFCYYNNYNLSQPRHFCKSCHRYWTRGGALRKVPVGGGTRKPAASNKRRRIGIPPAATPTVISTDNNINNLVSCSTSENEATTAQTRYSDPVFSNPDTGLGSGCVNGVAVNLNDDAVGESGSLLGCWWNSTGQVDSGQLLLPFADGYGSGMGCGPDVLVWPPVDQATLGRGGDSTDAAVVSGESRTWQMGGGGGGGEGEGGGVAEVSDYFCWSDLAISTPAAKALK